MNPKVDVKSLQSLGGGASPWLLALLALALPALTLAGAWLFKYWKARAKQKRTLGPETLRPTAPGLESPDVGPRQLRRAWLRFVRRLPRPYRRSILNFDHFIVMGAAGAGKSRLLDAHTDYRYQTRQVAGDAPVDSELPVMLASGAVITELPARFLEDNSLAVRTALVRLWRPLYAKKAPTVVVVMDAMWLMQAGRGELLDLGLDARGKINLLAKIRKRAIEVRVALTNLDGVPGSVEVGQFWTAAGISPRLPLAADTLVATSLDAWGQEFEEQLPRALSLSTSEQYRQVVTFARGLPKLLTPLTSLLEALFGVDAMSESPLRGGVYFMLSPGTGTNPLRNALDTGAAPSPLRRHAFALAAIVLFALVYMSFAFSVQEDSWAIAADAAASYRVSPELVGSERERQQREKMIDFAVEERGLLRRFPDFHSAARSRIQALLSSKLREALLVPRLREVAQNGIVGPDNMTLRWRRSVYFLALIHSYHADKLGIRNRLELWHSMTGLPHDVIQDYLGSVAHPFKDPLKFKLADNADDPRDRIAYWARLPEGVIKATVDRDLTPKELGELQAVAKDMQSALARFEHDDETLEIFSDLDSAADDGGERDGKAPPKLRDTYAPLFGQMMQNVGALDLQRQVGELRRLTEVILASSIDVPALTSLHDLVDRLELSQREVPRTKLQGVALKLGEREFALKLDDWEKLIQGSRAALLIDRFVAATAEIDSIFFTPDADAELRSVVWNPLASPDSIFLGKARLLGRYTKTAFDTRVKKEVARLVTLVGTLELAPERKSALYRAVGDELSEYANAYRREALAFLRAYQIRATTAEALRVALGQISSEQSVFDDFVQALAENTTLVDRAASTVKPAAQDSKAGAPDAELNRLLEPVYQALADFGPWHDAASETELKKYKEIAKQLLTDLGPPPADGGRAAKPADDSALTGELSPLGRVALSSLSGKASYTRLVEDWVTSMRLTVEQQLPFLAPFQQFATAGESDIEGALSRTWNREMAPLVRAVAAKFPFDRDAEETASPEELTALFHPSDGKLFSLFRGYLGPSADSSGQPSPLSNSVRLPADLEATARSASALAARLWDEKGAPRKIVLKVTPQPFVTTAGARRLPTMVYFNVGGTSVVNFNQSPEPTEVSIDWTRDEPAQIGLQITDAETQEQSFPSPAMARGPYFRLFRLLRQAKVSKAKGVTDSELYEWRLSLGQGSDTVRVAVSIAGDAWKGLSLPRVARTSR
jgi:hypothetical protein